MLATGMRTPVGAKIFGLDLTVLQILGTQIESLLREVPGTRSAIAERGASGYYLDIDIDRPAAARLGLNVMDVRNALMGAVGGLVTTDAIDGREDTRPSGCGHRSRRSLSS